MLLVQGPRGIQGSVAAKWIRYPDAVGLSVYRVDHGFEWVEWGVEIRLVGAGMNPARRRLTNDSGRESHGWWLVMHFHSWRSGAVIGGVAVAKAISEHVDQANSQTAATRPISAPYQIGGRSTPVGLHLYIYFPIAYVSLLFPDKSLFHFVTPSVSRNVTFLYSIARYRIRLFVWDWAISQTKESTRYGLRQNLNVRRRVFDWTLS